MVTDNSSRRRRIGIPPRRLIRDLWIGFVRDVLLPLGWECGGSGGGGDNYPRINWFLTRIWEIGERRIGEGGDGLCRRFEYEIV